MASLLGLASSCFRAPLPDTAKKPVVIVSVSPYDTFVKEISGDTLDVRVAVPANYDSHMFEPSPNQLQGFQHATLWFGIGEPFEKKLLYALQNHNKDLIQIDLSHNLPLDSYHETAVAIGSCSHHHVTDHESIDLHFWMSPRIAAMQAEMIAQSLITIFPQYAHLYRENWLKLQKHFETLHQDLHLWLEPIRDHAVIISHPSLGYFCKEYHLIQISIECEGKTVMPNDLNKILSLSQKHPVCCVFTQEQFDNKGALSIAKRLHLPVYTINPNNPDYFNNLEQIAHEMTQAPSP